MNQTNLATHFGASIRRLRFRLGISQEELADRADLHRTYIAGIERGGRNITLKSVEKLARALQVSAAELMAVPSKGQEASEGKATGDFWKEILLAEDDSREIEAILRAFRVAGVANPVHVARDGATALAYLFCAGVYAHRSGSRGPAVALLNLELPRIRGVEVLRRMKRHPGTREIPVIMLSASEKSREIAECRRLGALAYMIKPFDIRDFGEVSAELGLQWALLGSPSLAAD